MHIDIAQAPVAEEGRLTRLRIVIVIVIAGLLLGMLLAALK